MQGLPALAWNETDGQYLVVWQDGRNKFYEGWNIYGVRVGAGGAPIGSEFRISVPTSETDQVRPAVAWNGEANEYLVVWEDYRLGETRGADVYGRRIRADGVPAGGDFRISGAAGIFDQGGPALAWNATANEYLVVWEDYRAQDTRSADIYGRRLGPTGTALTGDRRLSAINGWSGQIAPAVVYNATADEYFVVWEDWRSDLGGGSIFWAPGHCRGRCPGPGPAGQRRRRQHVHPARAGLERHGQRVLRGLGGPAEPGRPEH